MPSDAAIICHLPREELVRDLPSDSSITEAPTTQIPSTSTAVVVDRETASANPSCPKQQQVTPRLQPAIDRLKKQMMGSARDIRGSITSESSFIVVHNTLKVAWEKDHQSRSDKSRKRRRSVDGSVTTITPSTSDLSIATLGGGGKHRGEVFGHEEGRGSVTPRLGALKEAGQSRQRWRLSDMDIIERLSLT